RLFQLVSIAIENPVDLTTFGAFNMRVLNAPMALHAGLIEGDGLGMGVARTDIENIYEFSIAGTDISKSDTGKAHGGVVLFVYQVGVFAAFWIFGFLKL